jgi:hypothetical protein
MTISQIIAAAAKFGPRYVGGLPNIDRTIAALADAAGNSTGTFLADLEDAFPTEFAEATEA